MISFQSNMRTCSPFPDCFTDMSAWMTELSVQSGKIATESATFWAWRWSGPEHQTPDNWSSKPWNDGRWKSLLWIALCLFCLKNGLFPGSDSSLSMDYFFMTCVTTPLPRLKYWFAEVRSSWQRENGSVLSSKISIHHTCVQLGHTHVCMYSV